MSGGKHRQPKQPVVVTQDVNCGEEEEEEKEEFIKEREEEGEGLGRRTKTSIK